MATQSYSASYSATVYSNSGTYPTYSLSSPSVGEGSAWYYVYDFRGLTIGQATLPVTFRHNNPYSSTKNVSVSVKPYIAKFVGSGDDLRVSATGSLGTAQTRSWTISTYNTLSHEEEFVLELNTVFQDSTQAVEVLLLEIKIAQGTDYVTLESVPSVSIDSSGDTPGDDPSNPTDPSNPEEPTDAISITNLSVGTFDPIEYGSGIVVSTQSLEISITASYQTSAQIQAVYVVIEKTNGNSAARVRFSGSPATLTGHYSLEQNTTYNVYLSAEGHKNPEPEIYESWSGASESRQFTTGSFTYLDPYDVSCAIVKPQSGNKRNGSADIPFVFTVNSQGTPTAYEAQYTTDSGETWHALASDVISGQSEVQFVVPAMSLPSGSITWRVRAKANGDYKDNWTSAAFTVTYDGYGKIVATGGPINKGARILSPISYTAGIEIVGQTADNPIFQEAKFYWRSGETNSFVSRDMSVSNDTAQITIPTDVLPVGLVQWYMYGKDSTGVESETPVYVTYILKSSIDSFPIQPISSIKQTEDAIAFTWGYISENAQPLSKAEIQFSEDGVTWKTAIPVSFEEMTVPEDSNSQEDEAMGE